MGSGSESVKACSKLRNISAPNEGSHPIKRYLKSQPPAPKFGKVHWSPKNPWFKALQLACGKISQSLIISKISQHTNVPPGEGLHLWAPPLSWEPQGFGHIAALPLCYLGSAGVWIGLNKGAVTNCKYWAIINSLDSEKLINYQLTVVVLG